VRAGRHLEFGLRRDGLRIACAGLDLSTYLEHDLRPALGCTEPAAVAHAAARAAEQAGGDVLAVRVRCDRMVFKNCHAAVIPQSGGKVGGAWAAALGALLPDASAGLEAFRWIDGALLEAAERLVRAGGVTVEVDPEQEGLYVDCQVTRAGGTGRAVLADRHTRLVQLERDGAPRPLPGEVPAEDRDAEVDAWLRGLSLADALRLAGEVGSAARARLREGRRLNLAISHRGLDLLPASFVEASRAQPASWASCLVCAGVAARMSGVDSTAMTLAGSGNKGITVAVGLALRAEREGAPDERLDVAHALACLVTSAATRRLGSVSPMCGVANAAGIGLAAGLVALGGGGEEELSRAVTNMVGDVAGMICDGAKPGCGLKAATAVDAADRAAALALAGFAIAAADGIVGSDGARSLDHLERVARRGMPATEAEVVRILREKSGGGALQDRG